MIQRVLVAVAFACVLAGCGSGGGTSGDSAPPQVAVARIDPGYLGPAGGQAYVRAEVSDPSGVAWVRATLTRPDGGIEHLDLALRPGGYYEAGFTAAYNASGADQIYTATVTAADQRGNVASPVAATPLRVGADTGPPPPPPL